MKIRNTPGVVATAPYVQGPVIVEFHNRRLAPMIRGIDPAEEEKVIPLRSSSSRASSISRATRPCSGSSWRSKLQIDVGDKLTVYSPGILAKFSTAERARKNEGRRRSSKAVDELREVVLPKELTVTGIFETGHYLHDSEFLLVPLYVGQELYGLGDALHGITVKTVDPYSADSRENGRSRSFSQPPEYAQTWIEMNNQFFEAVRLERTVMFFLLFFIVVVAAFGIMNTLITVTVQKRREIGIMKAIGANIWQIVWVFLGQGIVVGFFGTLTGLGLGMTLIRYRNEFSQWLAIDASHRDFPAAKSINFREIPAAVVPSDVAKICISAFLICSFARSFRPISPRGSIR